MRFSLFISVLFAALLLVLVKEAAWAADPLVSHHEFTQHFEPARDNGSPVVEIHFNETVTGRFLIDTGMPDCLMTDAFAKRLGFQAQPSDHYVLGMKVSESHPAALVQVPAFNIGSFRITDAAFLIVDNEQLPAMSGQPLDGVLGGTLLARFALLLDGPRHNLVWIAPGNLNDEAIAALGFHPQDVISLDQETYYFGAYKVNHYSTRATLRAGEQEHKEEMLIDTGAPLTSLSYGAAQHLKLMPLRAVSVGLVFFSPDTAEVARVPMLQLGHVALPDVSVVYPADKGFLLPPLLGENVLSGSLSLFDFGPHRFYLKPVEPWLLPGPLPPLDPAQIDADRLRRAPELPTPTDILATGLKPAAFEGLPTRLARLRAGLTGGAEDGARYEEIGALLRSEGDEAGAKAALEQAIALCRADSEAQPDDAVRAAAWVSALLLGEPDGEAISVAQRAAARLPNAPLVWRSLGQAQEIQAARLLLGSRLHLVPEDFEDQSPAFESPDVDSLEMTPPASPEDAVLAQAQTLRQQARDSLDKSVALAPADAESYQARGMFWSIEHRLILRLRSQKVKDQAFSPEAALAGALADYQAYARLRPDDPKTLQRAALVDLSLPLFHDRRWLGDHLRGTGQTLGPDALLTAQAAQAHLTVLTQRQDKSVAASAWTALGTVQDAQDDDAHAETSWRRALALDPVQPEAVSALAAQMFHKKRLDDLQTFLTAQIAQQDTVPVRLLLAAVLNALHRSADAEAQARGALQASPDNPAACQFLAGLLLAKSGDAPAVLPAASRYLAKAKDGYGPQASDEHKASLETMQAVLAALNGDPNAARQQLLTLVKDQPVCTQAREALSSLTPIP